jgi:hypothetical protein
MSKFSATTYSVGENAGTFNVTVLRTGNTAAAATVKCSDNGTGTATGVGVHYSLPGTLNFAPGGTSKTCPDERARPAAGQRWPRATGDAVTPSRPAARSPDHAVRKLRLDPRLNVRANVA